VENRFGLHPAAEPDGSPAPIEIDAALDRLRLLERVTTFNLHPHLPHLERLGDADRAGIGGRRGKVCLIAATLTRVISSDDLAAWGRIFAGALAEREMTRSRKLVAAGALVQSNSVATRQRAMNQAVLRICGGSPCGALPRRKIAPASE
jgi:hypothetical protein